MQRTIVGFHQDAHGDWVAELSCLHNQHVRHQPPFQERPWVPDEAQRAAQVGAELNCPLCDRAELPEGLQLARTAGPMDSDPPVRVRAEAGRRQPIPPGVLHALTLDGPVRLTVEVLLGAPEAGVSSPPG